MPGDRPSSSPIRRPPSLPPSVDPKQIRILHPAHKQETTILLLHAHVTGRDPVSHAFPLSILLAACEIVANNKSGWLSKKRGGMKIKSSTISPGNYFFHIDENVKYNYPVCPNFRLGSPPYTLPQPWLSDNRTSSDNDVKKIHQASDASRTVHDKDPGCVMTGEQDRLEAVHLVPKAEERWFDDHGLTLLANDLDSFHVDNTNNLVLLRGDLTRAGLDQGDFCFVPYKDEWINLWMGPGSASLANQFNFASVALPPRIRARYLHTRFAWNVFRLTGLACPSLTRLRYVGAGAGAGTGPAGARQTQSKQNLKGKGKRPAEDPEVEESGLKKKRPDSNDPPDVSPINVELITRIKRLDERLSKDSRLQKSFGQYPGFSSVMEAAYDYRRIHPAATDPGNARIALVSEREESQAI
ncbi:hypothetical protein B0H12DRAFT_1070694 [Mycena haematopus]|nr:hypothetical protein B0H12DRAFT_1070694 [Mycena haematopus]